MDELKVVPGLRLKASGFLDFSKSENFVRGLELGVQGDFFTRKIDLLDQGTNQAIFIGGTIGLWIGNAW